MYNLDSKDYAILRELDINFRESFSKIGKKVRLSKNSVALRFEKLKEYMLYNIVGINVESLGYTLVKVFYTFDFYNENTEKAIKNETKKYHNMIWAARLFGPYDVCIALLVKDMDEIKNQVNEFNRKFAEKISQKEIQIVSNQYYFRHNYLHEKPIPKRYSLTRSDKRVELSKTDIKILLALRYNPRISLVDLSKKTKLSTKTVANRMKILEKDGVIMGYFMTLDQVKFNRTTFKLLIQVQDLEKNKDFEDYVFEQKNLRYVSDMLGLWDYEIDLAYESMNDLQRDINVMKEKFPDYFKKISIISVGRRLVTNEDAYLD